MKKISMWLLAAAALTLAACGDKAEQEAAKTETKKIVIGTEGAYPPFNSIDANGQLVGFDVDIAKAVCAAANLECTFVAQDWDGIIPGLIAKKYDAIAASMSITEERKKQVDFSNKYYHTPAKFVAKKGAGIEVAFDKLAGKVIGVQRATIHENFLRDNFPGVDVRVYATQDEVNADLAAGRLDMVMADSVVLNDGFLMKPEGANFEFVGPDYADPKWHGQGVGIAVRKGETDLLNAFNEAIKKIRADGTYKKINDQYFKFDVYGKEVTN